MHHGDDIPEQEGVAHGELHNVERVWVAEQQEKDEQRKIEEYKKQIKEERDKGSSRRRRDWTSSTSRAWLSARGARKDSKHCSNPPQQQQPPLLPKRVLVLPSQLLQELYLRISPNLQMTHGENSILILCC